MKKYTILKLVGMALLTMITLIVISFAEVTVYSYVINPGQEASVYDAHANDSAPYVSAIFGFLIFFLVARYWKTKGYDNAFQLAILFPVTYIVLDVVVLSIAAFSQWSTFFWIFILANASKFLGSYLGNRLTKGQQTLSTY